MPLPLKNSGVAPVGATPSALMPMTFPVRGSKMRAWVSPPQLSVSHIVAVAAIIAQAASTALPPFAKIKAPAVAPSGLPVMAIQRLPCSGGFTVRGGGWAAADDAAARTRAAARSFFMRASYPRRAAGTRALYSRRVAAGLDPARSSRARALAVALLATLAVLAAQAALVHLAYGGNWTALFYSGERYGVPPELAAEGVHLFPGTGYDGQIYHAIAHDPLLRRGVGVSSGVDAPRLRYRRVLVPLLAWLGAAGNGARRRSRVSRRGARIRLPRGVLECALGGEGRPLAGLGRAVRPVAGVGGLAGADDRGRRARRAGRGLGARGRARFAARVGRPRRRAAGPGDGAAPRRRGRDRRPRRSGGSSGPRWRRRARSPPARGSRTCTRGRPPPTIPNSFVPLGGIVNALLNPAAYGGGPGLRAIRPAVLQALDVLALVGIVLAFVIAAGWLKSAPRSPLAWAAALFALIGVFTQRPDNWAHVYDYGRVYSPLLLLLALEGLARRDARWAAPWLLMEPRLLWQLSGPAAAALRGLFG